MLCYGAIAVALAAVFGVPGLIILVAVAALLVAARAAPRVQRFRRVRTTPLRRVETAAFTPSPPARRDLRALKVVGAILAVIALAVGAVMWQGPRALLFFPPIVVLGVYWIVSRQFDPPSPAKRQRAEAIKEVFD